MPVVLYEKKDKIAYITLNRPEVRNAINVAMEEELERIWNDVAADPAVWVAIVAGAGERAFSSGADIGDLADGAQQPGKSQYHTELGGLRLLGPMRIWKPFIAAVNGYAIGSGFTLALSCDMRVAADNASFYYSEIKRGIPTAVASVLLPRYVTFGQAMEVLLTGDSVDAWQAYRMGLVNKVVSPDKLMSAAEDLARRICEAAPLAVQASKEIAIRGLSMPVAEGLRFGNMVRRMVRDSQDAKEGPRAYAEKRKPVWKGQ